MKPAKKVKTKESKTENIINKDTKRLEATYEKANLSLDKVKKHIKNTEQEKAKLKETIKRLINLLHEADVEEEKLTNALAVSRIKPKKRIVLENEEETRPGYREHYFDDDGSRF